MSVGNFIYWNQNPKSKIEPDCVCRAISLATGIPYYRVDEMLSMVGEYYVCEDLCVNCYRHLLSNIFGFPNLDNVDGLTIEQFCNNFPQGIYLVRVDGHLTTVLNSHIIDIWDCSQEFITDVWRVTL